MFREDLKSCLSRNSLSASQEYSKTISNIVSAAVVFQNKHPYHPSWTIKVNFIQLWTRRTCPLNFGIFKSYCRLVKVEIVSLATSLWHFFAKLSKLTCKWFFKVFKIKSGTPWVMPQRKYRFWEKAKTWRRITITM